MLKVPEYFLFDPLEELPAGKFLCGYRLVNGEYELIPETEGRLISEVLGLHLEAAGEHLRLYDPRHGVYLLRLQEVREVLKGGGEGREVKASGGGARPAAPGAGTGGRGRRRRRGGSRAAPSRDRGAPPGEAGGP